MKAAGGEPPRRAQPLRGFKRSEQHWGWAADAAWGWKDTDKSRGTEKQHKAINNRSKFISVRVLGDPTSPGAGVHPAPRSSGQTLLQGTACHTHTGQSGLFCTVHTAGAACHSTTRPRTLPSLRSHLRGRCVAVLILGGLGLTLSILGTVLLKGLAR